MAVAAPRTRLFARPDFECPTNRSNPRLISFKFARRLTQFQDLVSNARSVCCHDHLRSRSKFVTYASVYENVLPSSEQDGSNSSALGGFQATPSPARALSSGGLISNARIQRLEELIEQSIFNCRFLTLMGVVGSLAGSILCFFKGCTFVFESFTEYFFACLRGIGTGKVILLLVEAVDVYLMGTVMLIFGMGLYELFVSSFDVPDGNCFSNGQRTTVCGSNLFGLFHLRARPKWLEIRSLDELKTKLGHVIVMILLVGMFEKSKKVPIHSGVDLLCFSASILLSSGCLFLLSKLHSVK